MQGQPLEIAVDSADGMEIVEETSEELICMLRGEELLIDLESSCVFHLVAGSEDDPAEVGEWRSETRQIVFTDASAFPSSDIAGPLAADPTPPEPAPAPAPVPEPEPEPEPEMQQQQQQQQQPEQEQEQEREQELELQQEQEQPQQSWQPQPQTQTEPQLEQPSDAEVAMLFNRVDASGNSGLSLAGTQPQPELEARPPSVKLARPVARASAVMAARDPSLPLVTVAADDGPEEQPRPSMKPGLEGTTPLDADMGRLLSAFETEAGKRLQRRQETLLAEAAVAAADQEASSDTQQLSPRDMHGPGRRGRAGSVRRTNDAWARDEERAIRRTAQLHARAESMLPDFTPNHGFRATTPRRGGRRSMWQLSPSVKSSNSTAAADTAILEKVKRQLRASAYGGGRRGYSGRRLFATLDRDRDGVLSLEEWSRALRGPGKLGARGGAGGRVRALPPSVLPTILFAILFFTRLCVAGWWNRWAGY
jgi:hypothetical protein